MGSPGRLGRRIELFGCAGAGKTTLYRAILALPERKPYLQPWKTFARTRKLSQPEGIRRAFGADRDFDRFLQNYLHQMAVGKDAPLMRLKRAAWLVEDLRQAAAADFVDDGPLVLFDENLCQRGISLLLSKADRRFVDSYFRSVPPPLAIVAVMPPAEAITSNLRARAAESGTMQRHKSSVQTAVDTALAVLGRRGSKILALGGTDIAANAQSVVEFARALQQGTTLGTSEADPGGSPVIAEEPTRRQSLPTAVRQAIRYLRGE